MKFSDIIGHKSIITSLRESVDADHIPHAIMLGGQEGIGKMRVARAFISYLYCMDRQDGDSCGKCPACLQNAHHNNPDVHYVFPRTGANSKSTDTFLPQWQEFLDKHSYMSKEEWARAIDAGNSVPVIYRNDAAEISRTAALSSFVYKYKTYVIWMPEKMQLQCANALLKLLEEPFPDTLFILVSNEPDMLLPTIFSRTQRFNLKPLREDEIREILQSEGISYTEATEVAALSEGSVIKALDMTGDGGEIKEFSMLYMQMMRLAYAQNAAGLRMLSDSIAAMSRDKNARFLSYCSRLTRENFIFNLRNPQLNAMTKSEEEFSLRFSPFISHRNVERLISEIQKAHDDILRNANARLVMFDFMLKVMIRIKKQDVKNK